MTLVHPQAVWRAFDASRRPRAAAQPAAASPFSKLRAENVRLQEENDALRKGSKAAKPTADVARLQKEIERLKQEIERLRRAPQSQSGDAWDWMRERVNETKQYMKALERENKELAAVGTDVRKRHRAILRRALRHERNMMNHTIRAVEKRAADEIALARQRSGAIDATTWADLMRALHPDTRKTVSDKVLDRALLKLQEREKVLRAR